MLKKLDLYNNSIKCYEYSFTLVLFLVAGVRFVHAFWLM